MSTGQLLVVLVVAVVTFAATAVLRRRGVPTPVVLVVAGLVIGFLPFVPDVPLNPDVVLLGLLPLLVYQAAYTASPRAFSRNALPIGLLAVVLVVLTAAAVAAVAPGLAHLSWPMSFVLGTAMGPTDAAAATAIVSRLGLPWAGTARRGRRLVAGCGRRLFGTHWSSSSKVRSSSSSGCRSIPSLSARGALSAVWP
jgi:NhaP-type Na+/H+ or K+/H+ antiporter